MRTTLALTAGLFTLWMASHAVAQQTPPAPAPETQQATPNNAGGCPCCQQMAQQGMQMPMRGMGTPGMGMGGMMQPNQPTTPNR